MGEFPSLKGRVVYELDNVHSSFAQLLAVAATATGRLR